MIDEKQTHRQRRRSNRRKELEQLRAENKELLKRISIKNEQRKISKSKAKAEVVKKGSHVMSNLGALLNDVDTDQRLSSTTTCKQPLPPPSHVDIKTVDVDIISSISINEQQPRLVSPNPSDSNFFFSTKNEDDLVSFGSTNFFTNSNTKTNTIEEKDTLFSRSLSKFNKESDDPFNDDSTPISLSSSTHQQKPEKNKDEDMKKIDDLAKRYNQDIIHSSCNSNGGDSSVKPTKQKDTRVSLVREQHMNEIEKLRKLQQQQQEQQQTRIDEKQDTCTLSKFEEKSCNNENNSHSKEEDIEDGFELPFEQLLQEAEKMMDDNCDNNEEEDGYIGVVNTVHPTNKESEALRLVPSLALRRSSISSTIKKSIRRKRSNNNKVVDKADDENDKENVHPTLGYKKGMSNKRMPTVQRDIPSALREQKDKSTTLQETNEKKTVRFDEYTKEANNAICVHGGGHDISYDDDDTSTRDTFTLDESITVNPAGGCAADYFSWLANCGQDDNQEVEVETQVDDDETMDNTIESSLISMDDDDTATTQASNLFGLHTLVDSGCKFMSISDASKVHTLY